MRGRLSSQNPANRSFQDDNVPEFGSTCRKAHVGRSEGYLNRGVYAKCLSVVSICARSLVKEYIMSCVAALGLSVFPHRFENHAYVWFIRLFFLLIVRSSRVQVRIAPCQGLLCGWVSVCLGDLLSTPSHISHARSATTVIGPSWHSEIYRSGCSLIAVDPSHPTGFLWKDPLPRKIGTVSERFSPYAKAGRLMLSAVSLITPRTILFVADPEVIKFVATERTGIFEKDPQTYSVLHVYGHNIVGEFVQTFPIWAIPLYAQLLFRLGRPTLEEAERNIPVGIQWGDSTSRYLIRRSSKILLG